MNYQACTEPLNKGLFSDALHWTSMHWATKVYKQSHTERTQTSSLVIMIAFAIDTAAATYIYMDLDPFSDMAI